MDLIFTSEYLQPLVLGEPPLHYIRGISPKPNAPLLIFLHGFPESAYAWSDFLPYYLERGYTVLAPDQRGYLLSTGYKKKVAFQMDSLVEDVKRLIEHHPSENISIVGHDLGGAVVWRLAEKYPMLCQSIILLNSPHPGTHSKMFRSKPWLTVRQTFRLWYLYFFQLPRLPEWIMSKGNGFWLDYIFKRWIRKESKPLLARIKFYKRSLVGMKALKESIETYRCNVFGVYGLRLLKPYFFKCDYEPIKASVLMLWGGRDFLFENELLKHTRAFCENDITFHTWQEGGHWLHHEYLKEVILKVNVFLKKEGVIPINDSQDERTFSLYRSIKLMTLFDECLKMKNEL